MNQYTLTFRSTKIEAQYQLDRQKYAIQVFKVLTLTVFIISLVRFVVCYVTDDALNYIIFGPVAFIIPFIYVFLMRHRKSWIPYTLATLNIILMAYQSILYDFSDQEAYIYGSNMMILHITVILITDFKYSVIQLIAGFVIKLSIPAVYSISISLQTYLAAVFGIILFIQSLYLINRHYRQSFLLTIKDTQWDIILPMLVKQQYFIFTYDQNYMKYNILSQNNNCLDSGFIDRNRECSDLTTLIRKYYFRNQTLEYFIQRRQKSNDSYIMDKLIELHNPETTRDKIVIRYTEFFSTQKTFVIIMAQDEQQYKAAQQKYSQLKGNVRIFTHIVRTFLLKQLKLVNQIKTNSKNKYIHEARLMYMIVKFPTQTGTYKSNCDLTKKISSYAKIFNKAEDKNYIDFHIYQQQNTMIFTYTQILDTILTILMTSIMRVKISKVTLQIEIIQIDGNNYIDIVIRMNNIQILLMILQKQTKFIQALRRIGPKANLIKDGQQIFIRLFQNIHLVEQLHPLNYESFPNL